MCTTIQDLEGMLQRNVPNTRDTEDLSPWLRPEYTDDDDDDDDDDIV